MTRFSVPLAPLALLLALGASGCPALNAPPLPQAHCQEECHEHAPRCSEHDCARGCGFVVDRLTEHEEAPVVACVASRSTGAPSNGAVWADCAVLVGVHADGGPPAPPAPSE
jgi:hypothetical protein